MKIIARLFSVRIADGGMGETIIFECGQMDLMELILRMKVLKWRCMKVLKWRKIGVTFITTLVLTIHPSCAYSSIHCISNPDAILL